MDTSVLIMVVDDDAHLTRSLSDILKVKGYDCVGAGDGESALRLVHECCPAAVLIDLKLPSMGGLALMNSIKAVSPETECIILTGYASQESAIQAVNAGAFFYMQKPYDVEQLLLTVARAIEKRETNRALQSSETRFRDLINCSPDMVWRISPEGILTFVSSAAKSMLGYEAEELLGKTFDAVLRPQSAVMAREALEHLKRGDWNLNDAVRELVHRRKDGAEVVGEIRAAPIMGPHGELLEIQGVTRDITARHKAETERRRLAMAMEHSADAIVITDPDGTIQYVNPAFERITGYTRLEAVGKNPRILKSGKHDAAFYAQLWNTITAGHVWSGHFFNLRKSGALYEEETTISPVTDETANIINYVAIKRDISDKVALERRLRQAQKMEAIGTLAGGIAHDFNNALAAIIGYTQIAVADLPEDSDLQGDLSYVLAAADRAKDLVRQILTFSRWGDEERKPVEISLIVKEALKLLRPSLPSNIDIHTHIDTGCRAVLADPTQIHQVLMNLCTNAYHAMGEHGGALTVSLEPFAVTTDFAQSHPGLHEGVYVRLLVDDTGCGMEKQTLDRIFEPFFTTKAQGEGTGLGLATVHGIVSAHGGAVTVYSELGRGTSFHVYLPCVEIPLSAEQLLRQPIRGGHETILVIDDEAELAHLMEATLKRFGYNVVAMTDSMDAVAAFRAHPELFDLVITDHMMPKMTGERIASEVLATRPNTPIIVTTGFAGNNLKDKLNEMGICAFLVKPADTFELARLVREVLDAPHPRSKS